MKKIIPILIAILICFGVGCTASYFQSEPYSTGILHWTNLLLHHLIWLFPLLGALSICALGNFYRVDLAYVDNKTTNDYQIIRVPALV